MREYVLEKRIKLERAEAFSLEMISAAWNHCGNPTKFE